MGYRRIIIVLSISSYYPPHERFRRTYIPIGISDQSCRDDEFLVTSTPALTLKNINSDCDSDQDQDCDGDSNSDSTLYHAAPHHSAPPHSTQTQTPILQPGTRSTCSRYPAQYKSGGNFQWMTAPRSGFPARLSSFPPSPHT